MTNTPSSIQWEDTSTPDGHKCSVLWVDSVRLLVRTTTIGRGGRKAITYEVSSRYDDLAVNKSSPHAPNFIKARKMEFDSMDAAKEWLLNQTIQHMGEVVTKLTAYRDTTNKKVKKGKV